MSQETADREKRMAEVVRLVIARRERAPRSPRMERALKRLIWRYSQEMQATTKQDGEDVQE